MCHSSQALTQFLHFLLVALLSPLHLWLPYFCLQFITAHMSLELVMEHGLSGLKLWWEKISILSLAFLIAAPRNHSDGSLTLRPHSNTDCLGTKSYLGLCKEELDQVSCLLSSAFPHTHCHAPLQAWPPGFCLWQRTLSHPSVMLSLESYLWFYRLSDSCPE